MIVALRIYDEKLFCARNQETFTKKIEIKIKAHTKKREEGEDSEMERRRGQTRAFEVFKWYAHCTFVDAPFSLVGTKKFGFFFFHCKRNFFFAIIRNNGNAAMVKAL